MGSNSLDSVDQIISPLNPRTRRLSEGSLNANNLRKDLLLQRMAEALQTERTKALVFQRELQNAEREIDELASTLDEQRRVHHRAIQSFKKDIKLLKKERESLVEALEAAEGVEQEDAERYLALLDPAAQAVMAQDDDESVEKRIDRSRDPKNRSIPPHQPPIFDDEYDPADYKTTIRAQVQERSALRAQRINSELLKIHPPSSLEPNLADDLKLDERRPTDRSKSSSSTPALGSTWQGRSREPPTRIHRKLSKHRPSSRDGTSGVGLFWRRSGSRNRENSDDKSSSVPGTIYRRKLSTTHSQQPQNSSIGAGGGTDDDGYYDSGPLQRSHDSINSQHQGKIGKLFRKVFPMYREDSDHTVGRDHGDHHGYADEGPYSNLSGGHDPNLGGRKSAVDRRGPILAHDHRRPRSTVLD